MKRWVNISDAVEITNNRVKPFKGERRYLATGDLIGDEVNESIVSVDYESKPSRADLLVGDGDIIVARMQATNKVLLIDKSTEDLIVSTGFLTLQPQKDFDGSYLAHYFRSDVFQKKKDKYCSGATQKAINNGAFAKLQVPSYSLDEQKRIANILDQADALRQKRKQSLRLLDDFLRTTFLDMFGDPVSNDKRWPVKKLSEVSFVKIGPFGSLLHREDYIANGIPLVNPTHIVNKKICPDFNFTISDKKREELRQYLLKEGDIILARRGEIGRCGLITQKEDGYLCGTGSLFVRPQKDLNPIYLVYLISSQSMRKNLENSSVGVTMKNLNAGIVENTVIIYPDKKLQDKFEAVVLETDSLKNSMENSIEQLDNEFNALTQRYFG